MNKLLLVLTITVLCISAKAQSSYVPSEANLTARKAFEEARFGMFIHWGASSVLCDGEWVMNNRGIKAVDYARLIDFFNPQDFNAAEWVKIAKDAGMKYITFVSRHHDSFSNWDTKQSDWKITNTPYGKDVIKLLADECQKQGIKLGLYYSTLDWFRPDYQWQTGRTGKSAGRPEQNNWSSYIQFMKAQLTELLTGYGPISAIWFDGHWDQTADQNRTDHTTAVDWHYDEIYALIHQLQPQCLVANNHHLPTLPGEDFQIFERDLPGENAAGYSGQAVAAHLPLETCATVSDSWGYNIKDDNYKSAKELVHLLVRAAGYGGNLLLNVGPMPNGKIHPEHVKRLAEVGHWTQKYGETVYGTAGGFIKPQQWGAITQKDKVYYIHILNKNSEELAIPFPAKIKAARWLDSEQKLNWKENSKTKQVTFQLDIPMDAIDTIIEVTTH